MDFTINATIDKPTIGELIIYPEFRQYETRGSLKAFLKIPYVLFGFL